MKRLFGASLLCLLALSALHAETYRWVDGRGVVSYTDNPLSIPEQYRKKAVRIDELPPPVEEIVIEPKGERKEDVSADKKEGGGQKKLYDGKDEVTWQREISRLAAEQGEIEKQIGDVDDRLAQKDKLSRSEYLSLQNTRRLLDVRLKKVRQAHESLLDEARRAGVPLTPSAGGGN